MDEGREDVKKCDGGRSLQAHMLKVRLHHPIHSFVKDLLGFLTGMFESVEEPVLVQLERVGPAWVAARGGGGESQEGMEDDGEMVCGEGGDRSGWLEEAGEKVIVGGMELREEEVEALMGLVEEWWIDGAA